MNSLVIEKEHKHYVDILFVITMYIIFMFLFQKNEDANHIYIKYEISRRCHT